MAAKCKSCGADIIWAETDKGKKVPLNAKPEKRFVSHTLFASDGSMTVGLHDTYLSHFATCPNAAEHRK